MSAIKLKSREIEGGITLHKFQVFEYWCKRKAFKVIKWVWPTRKVVGQEPSNLAEG